MASETELTEEKAPEADLFVVHTRLIEEHEALKAEHATLRAEHEDLKVQFGLAKKAYVWKEGDRKCAAVAHDGTCPECGWTAASREPHPVLT